MAAILSLLVPFITEIGTAYIWGEIIAFLVQAALYLIGAIILSVIVWKIANKEVQTNGN